MGGLPLSYAGDSVHETYTFGSVEIGKTTFVEIQNKYGKSISFKSGATDESNKMICYTNLPGRKAVYIVFEFGPMGGFNRTTGIRIASGKGNKKCSLTNIDLSKIKSKNGVHLFQERKDFLRKSKVSFKAVGATLTFHGESKRDASAVELKQLRKNWPNEKQAYFDIATTVKAIFNDGRLVDYYVSIIESY